MAGTWQELEPENTLLSRTKLCGRLIEYGLGELPSHPEVSPGVMYFSEDGGVSFAPTRSDREAGVLLSPETKAVYPNHLLVFEPNADGSILIDPARVDAAYMDTSEHWVGFEHMLRGNPQGGYEGRTDVVQAHRLSFERIMDAFLETAGVECSPDGTTNLPEWLGCLTIEAPSGQQA